jgi:hypothetical protein
VNNAAGKHGEEWQCCGKLMMQLCSRDYDWPTRQAKVLYIQMADCIDLIVDIINNHCKSAQKCNWALHGINRLPYNL